MITSEKKAFIFLLVNIRTQNYYFFNIYENTNEFSYCSAFRYAGLKCGFQAPVQKATLLFFVLICFTCKQSDLSLVQYDFTIFKNLTNL